MTALPYPSPRSLYCLYIIQPFPLCKSQSHTKMSKVELVFIPSPGLSHLVSTVHAAKILLARDHRLTITILIIKFPKTSNLSRDEYTKKLSSLTEDTSPGILQFIHLPDDHNVPPQSRTFLFEYINSRKEKIREVLSNLIEKSDSRLAGLVLDMFCTEFTQIAKEFGVPSYVFFTSGACSVGLFWDLHTLKFEHNQDLKQYKNSDEELSIRCFSQPLPAKVLPPVFVDEGPVGDLFLEYFKKTVDTKGILINTFYELEPFAIESLLSKYNLPKVYPVGPILELKRGEGGEKETDVMNWLDHQAENSVVFLCFGTMGSLDEAQVKEFAKALENCGSNFLWSLRKRGQGMMQPPSEYESFDEILPEGFLERTKGIGKVIGWAPQAAVLAHAAVGGFVSHCGWNSTLESVWFGVPIVALPLYSEQQMNAFELVKELEIAEAIRVDYRIDMKGESPAEIVPAEEIESAIRRVMGGEGGGVKGRVKEMQKKSREALEEGGSSYKSQIEFIEDVMRNVGFE